MLPTLTQRIQRTRLVTVGDDLSVDVDDEPTAYVPGRLLTHSGHTDRPRDAKPSRLFWLKNLELSAGSRVSVGDEEWELTGKPESLRAGMTQLRMAADVLRVAELYPRTAELRALGDDEVIAEIPFALYTPREQETDRGEYFEYEGECPIEFAAALEVANRRLVLGELTFNVGRRTVDYETPRVSLGLKRVAGSGADSGS